MPYILYPDRILVLANKRRNKTNTTQLFMDNDQSKECWGYLNDRKKHTQQSPSVNKPVNEQTKTGDESVSCVVLCGLN